MSLSGSVPLIKTTFSIEREREVWRLLKGGRRESGPGRKKNRKEEEEEASLISGLAIKRGTSSKRAPQLKAFTCEKRGGQIDPGGGNSWKPGVGKWTENSTFSQEKEERPGPGRDNCVL